VRSPTISELLELRVSPVDPVSVPVQMLGFDG
jgi:hypothetical protein